MPETTGKLVGIGVGPGDPELITLQATRALRSLAVVFVPKAAPEKASLAWEIARAHVPKRCEVVTLLFPMTRSENELSEHWRRAAEPVAERLVGGADCGFLTLGDPLLYSTFIYLKEAVTDLRPDVVVEMIPGISASFAAASKIGLPLARGDESIAYITGERADRVESLIEQFDTIVIMKVGKRLEQIRAKLNALGLLERTFLAHRLGLEGESVGPLSDVRDDRETGYMSTLIIRSHSE